MHWPPDLEDVRALVSPGRSLGELGAPRAPGGSPAGEAASTSEGLAKPSPRPAVPSPVATESDPGERSEPDDRPRGPSRLGDAPTEPAAPRSAPPPTDAESVTERSTPPPSPDPTADVSGHQREEAQPPDAARSRAAPDADSDESGDLEEIEAILGGDDEALEELHTTAAPGSSGRSSSPGGPAGRNPAIAPPLPAYFRDQVADLADIAQRIEGGLASARESRSIPGAEGDALANDVERLIQFTRTLSYLSSPPPRGNQVFDLSELIDTLVDTLPRKGPQSPRWLVRSNGPLRIRSDREILLQAFDALFFVAERCSDRGEIIRVQATALDDSPTPHARVAIEFPDTKLADLDPARILEPYALRRLLPDLGPNALSAASGIVAGQGGRLEIRGGRGRITWIVDLPLYAP
jgi:hypothetical protein